MVAMKSLLFLTAAIAITALAFFAFHVAGEWMSLAILVIALPGLFAHLKRPKFDKSDRS